MIDEKLKQKYLNKLKFIEKINGYDSDWVLSSQFTCYKYCHRALKKDCRGFSDKKLRYNIKDKTISYETGVDCTCVEFLRGLDKSEK